MIVFQQMYVKLRPFESLSKSNKITYQQYYQTPGNPSGSLNEGFVYPVLAINDRKNLDWQVLVINNRNEYAWLDFELLKASSEQEYVDSLRERGRIVNEIKKSIAPLPEVPFQIQPDDEATYTDENGDEVAIEPGTTIEEVEEKPKRGRPRKN